MPVCKQRNAAMVGTVPGERKEKETKKGQARLKGGLSPWVGGIGLISVRLACSSSACLAMVGICRL